MSAFLSMYSPYLDKLAYFFIRLTITGRTTQKLCFFLTIFVYRVHQMVMGLVVPVKKMSVLINFLLQNTKLVSVLSKICRNFAGHV